MKYLLSKQAISRSNIVCKIQIGKSDINFISRNGNIKAIIDSSEIFDAPMVKDTIPRVLTDTLKNVYDKEGSKKIVILLNNDYTDFLTELLSNIKDKIDNKNVVIKKDINNDLELSQFSMSGPINLDNLKINLEVFCNKIKKVIDTIQNCINCAQSFSRKKLIGTMWGAKDTQTYIDKIREKINKSNEECEKCEFFYDIIRKSVSRLNNKISQDSKNDNNIICDILIPDIIDNYDNIKSLIIKLLIIIAPIVYIDEIFQKNTSYPANWFFSDELLDDIKNGYDELIMFLSEIPRIETKVIYPLDFYKLQIGKTNER